jgi:hypothetical protein
LGAEFLDFLIQTGAPPKSPGRKGSKHNGATFVISGMELDFKQAIAAPAARLR